jgi:16S rRNA (guanine(527)-N(7))-methyltransferase RsmG
LTSKARWFRTICRHNGLLLDDIQVETIDRYVDLLLAWNRKLNLISKRDEQEVWERHILHSVSPLFSLVIPDNIRYLDLGTGGGLPGIPLKIMLPSSEAVLLDATRKKVNAVQEILTALGLPGIAAVWGRAEEFARADGCRPGFDVVLARGVAPLNELVRLAYPLLRSRAAESGKSTKERGRKRHLPIPSLLAFKGGELSSEVAKARRFKPLDQVEVRQIAFEGSEHLGLEDKKIVVVTFTTGR